MGEAVRFSQEKAGTSSALLLLHRAARLIVTRGLLLLIIAGFSSGCASHFIDVPQPARLSLTPATGMVIAVSDTSYREVVLALQLRKRLRKADFYHQPTDKELAEYLRRTGRSIQDLWKDPKLAHGLNPEIVVTPRVVEWKKDESAPVRKVYFDRPGVIQFCTNVSGMLRTSFTLWRSSDGVKLFERELSTSRRAQDCTPDLSIGGNPPKTSSTTEEKAVTAKPGVIVPDPFLTGALDASWESDEFYESVVRKAVSSFINSIDPSPVREMFITVNDMPDYASGRQLAKARTYLRDSNWAAALKLLESIEADHPDSYAAQYLTGIAHQGQLELGQAQKSYQQALALCQAKREASKPEYAPDCDFIADAYKNSQTWNTDVSPKDVPAAQ